MDACSSFTAEPLAGSAKPGSVYVLFEWTGGWPHDIGDIPELQGEIKRHLSSVNLQLIRHPGRPGHAPLTQHHCYLVWAAEEIIELVMLTGPEDLQALDLSGPGRNGARVIDSPLLLVCTHAKRDVCCAVKGRPLAAQLYERFPGDVVWEASHMKGHRFAPVSLLFPWAYSFGRLNVEAATAMLAAAQKGQYFYPNNRGNGQLKPAEQVAELAVAQNLIAQGEVLHYGELVIAQPGNETTIQIAHRDGRQWDVHVDTDMVEGVVASCGKSPKNQKIRVARSVTQTSSGS